MKITQENKHLFRFKTREEFEKEFGPDWAKKLKETWHENRRGDSMNVYFGKSAEILDFYGEEMSINDWGAQRDWWISEDMLTPINPATEREKPKSRQELEVRLKNAHEAIIQVLNRPNYEHGLEPWLDKSLADAAHFILTLIEKEVDLPTPEPEAPKQKPITIHFKNGEVVEVPEWCKDNFMKGMKSFLGNKIPSAFLDISPKDEIFMFNFHNVNYIN